MKKVEFETLAAAGALADVVIFQFVASSGYELWAYRESTDGRGEDLFKTAKGETRVWSSLDVLVKFIRSMGYHGLIKLDTVP